MVDFQVAVEKYTIDDLLNIMERLRAPDGCPWDRVQTHQSIRQNMLEEAYEAAEAIDHMDMVNLKEELGDVLLQVVFHARMAQEAGRFDFGDVVDGVCRKLVYRHPHVFGAVEAADPEGALDTWDAQKRTEKDQRTTGDALDGVARALPALTRAAKLQSKAAKAGFDWREVNPAVDKLSEELEELKTAIREESNVEEELGDLLFAAVKVGRFVQVDGETALQGACEKFIRRFKRVEALADRPLDQLEVSQLEALWQQAKKDA
ncbi:nucleoside triphosphate pyrophosphohydrolase [Pseudoflavonifractor sp. 60]|uniref:nucleoside triphosphate pyrophosphohydrolase n=1 Tax=Pseudoflavonifractor sp. 60 TaxID=2304576 RepID=UPI00136AFC77|nr:nucleoside triphosphate pyrophosphohydrolase [Pseudoflavonifractor sp. 60]